MTRPVVLLAALALAALVSPLAHAQTPPLAVLASPEAPGAAFGRAVAVEEGVAAVGAPEAVQREGAVTVYEQAQDGRWLPRQRLSGDEPGRAFGRAVALSGGQVVVGAVGAAYVYEREAGGTWALAATLVSPQPTSGDGFGTAVAADGARVAVAAPEASGETSGSGAVYIFERTANGTWVRGAELRRPAAEAVSEFGRAIALSGARLLIGGVAGRGVAYVYQRTGGAWEPAAELRSPDPPASGDDRFGSAVALHSDRAVVGAPGQASGAAYAFESDAVAGWTFRQRLTPPSLGADARFGFAVALHGDRAAVGAPGAASAGAPGAGLVRVFALTDGGAWTPRVDLRGSGSAGASFGLATSLSDRTVVTGEVETAFVHPAEATGPPGPPSGPSPPPPISLLVREAVSVRDVPQVGAAVLLFLREAVRVRDTPEARAALDLLVRESVAVRDESRASAALQLLVSETVGVEDAFAAVRALDLLVREGIAISDGIGVARADNSAASGAVRVDTERVALVVPSGLEIQLRGLSAPGSMSVYFQELRSAFPEGIPAGAELAPYRWELRAAGGLAFERARVGLRLSDLPRLTVTDANAIAVYVRPLAGGDFQALPTSVEDGEIVAEGVPAESEFTLAGTGLTVGTPEARPVEFGMSAPMPNPAQTRTRVVLSLPRPGPVQVDVLDLRGRRVATLVQGDLAAGETVLEIRADRFAAGTYILVLRSGEALAVSRLAVVR